MLTNVYNQGQGELDESKKVNTSNLLLPRCFMFHDSRKYLLRIDLFILEMIPSQGPLVNLLPALTFEASLSSSWKPL